MMDYFIPEDSESSDGAHHKRTRQLITEPMHTTDDILFRTLEIKVALEKFDPRIAPGEDALNSNVLLQVLRNFPTFVTEIYNACLQRGHFPNYWKRSIIQPIVKPGKEGLNEVTKCRPISLINTGVKLLEKLLIDRINHHLHTELLNRNQYGFIPQKSTVDAEMTAKHYALSHIQQRNYDIMVSLDVQGAFDAAWWPSILGKLRALNCPGNLYNLARSYFSGRVAILHSKNRKKRNEGMPPRILLRPRILECAIRLAKREIL
jgi:hypothetical protein